MIEETITLDSEQIPLVRLICELERKILPDLEDIEDSSHLKSSLGYLKYIISRTEHDASLPRNWRLKCRLIDLYSWSKTEINLLKDLRDAGGKSTTRSMDERFKELGYGDGGKQAINLSAQGDRWTVSLNDRGRYLLLDWDGL